MEFMPAHEIKRQILKAADSSIIKKKLENQPGVSDGELVEIGNNLERIANSPGWAIIEEYMIRRMNLVGVATGEETDKGYAKAYVELMQWIELSIRKRNEIIEKERLDYEAKTIQKEKINKRVEHPVESA